jgi:hypothetical protein
LPRYGAPLWLTADVDERRGGEPTVTLRGYFAGLPVEAVIRTVARAPQSVDVTQVRGTLRGFSQRFTIESGDEATLLGCRIEADPGIPMLSDEAVKHFLVQYVERMLDRLRLAAERRAPSRRPLRTPLRAEAGATDADEPTAADEVFSTGAPPAVDDGGPKDAAALSTPATGAPPDLEPAPDNIPPVSPARPPGPRSSGSRSMRSPASRPARRPPRDAVSRPPGPARPPAPAAQGAAPSNSSGVAEGAADPARSGQARRRRRRRRRRWRAPGGIAAEGAARPADPGGAAPNMDPESAGN